jgi:uncharacterized membrane protein (GlpM family)
MLQYMKDNYVFQFVLGGVLVSLISYMINQVDQTLASIVWSIPVTLLILVFIMNQSGKSNQTIADYIQLSIRSFLITMFSLYVWSKLITLTGTLWISLILSGFIWIGLHCLRYQLI